jgi:hypothetical protein
MGRGLGTGASLPLVFFPVALQMSLLVSELALAARAMK